MLRLALKFRFFLPLITSVWASVWASALSVWMQAESAFYWLGNEYLSGVCSLWYEWAFRVFNQFHLFEIEWHPTVPHFNDTGGGLEPRVKITFAPRDHDRPLREGVNSIAYAASHNYIYVNGTYPQRFLGFVSLMEEVTLNIEFPSLQSRQGIWLVPSVILKKYPMYMEKEAKPF